MLRSMLRRPPPRRARTPWCVGLCWLALPLLSSCTALVLQDASAAPACAADDDCPAATRCVDSVCAAVAPLPVPTEATLVDGAGGVIVGVDGLTLTIAPGALLGATAFTTTTASATLEYLGFAPTSRVYAVEPAATSATADGFRLALTDAGDGTTLFLRPTPPGPTWTAIAAEDDGTFLLPRTGTFAVGTPEAP
jgi:hypothetical protein